MEFSFGQRFDGTENTLNMNYKLLYIFRKYAILKVKNFNLTLKFNKKPIEINVLMMSACKIIQNFR